ncbi:type II toxin-antitoxin system YafQ family toxin [Celerinatantimonas sp. YJH-8]|uniref:type II toxin-antitoxin system RelE/ParE family toxin n=1 Tax=Celerinatantimonas sp. YJH-8 TaxID=3228714 RepID=UPI0038BFD971
MYKLEYSSQFKKDFKKVVRKAIPDVLAVGHIITLIQRGEAIPARCVDHVLSGNWNGFRDCHIQPDLVLIYRIVDDTVQLARIGSHSDLF